MHCDAQCVVHECTTHSRTGVGIAAACAVLARVVWCRVNVAVCSTQCMLCVLTVQCVAARAPLRPSVLMPDHSSSVCALLILLVLLVSRPLLCLLGAHSVSLLLALSATLRSSTLSTHPHHVAARCILSVCMYCALCLLYVVFVSLIVCCACAL